MIEDQHIVHSKRGGFTLVEIALVVLVLALIVTGAAVGKNLLAAAKLRSVMSEIETFQTAIMDFSEKYGGLPGDLQNATDHFSGASNGDGDEQIEWNILAASSAAHEGSQAWSQLQAAKMIGGEPLSGVGGLSIIDGNVPASAIESGGYTLFYVNLALGNFNYLILGSVTTIGSGGITTGALLTPDQAQTIDSKMDDGLPQEDTLAIALGTNCLAGSAGSYTYNSSYSLAACTMAFRLREEFF